MRIIKIYFRKFFLVYLLSSVSYPIIFAQVPILSEINNAAGKTDDYKTVDQIHYSIINNTAVTFDWVGTADRIYYGTDPDNLNLSKTASPAEFLPVTSPWVSDPGPYWEAKLTGLKQNTNYYYRIDSSGLIYNFHTPPMPGTGGFRICSTSDMHSNGQECVAMFNQIAGLNPDLVITTGDLTGAGPDGQQNVGIRFHDAMTWAKNAAWMPCWGNHDWECTGDDDLRTYKGRFDIPNPGTISSSPDVSCCGEDWGWFDYGNTRFISLPEPWTSATRNEWIKQAIPVFSDAQKDPDISFIVTFGHRSAYTSALDRSPGESNLRSILNGFSIAFSKYKLDLSGHNHQYERYQIPNGMTYIVNSTAGAYYRGWESSVKPSNCAFRIIHYGILVMDFSEDSIHGEFICSVGTTKNGSNYKPLEEDVCGNPDSVIDSFNILKFDRVQSSADESMNGVIDDFYIKNYPNPFNPSTKITYSLPQAGYANITVCDLLGHMLITIVHGYKEKGKYTFDWEAKDEQSNLLPSGVYVLHVQLNQLTTNTKMVLVR